MSGLVDWIVDSLENQKTITLYRDNMFSPITTWRLAEEIEHLLSDWKHGIWNISGKETVSKYEFGYRLAKQLGLDINKIKEGKLADQQSSFQRSIDQSIDSSRYEQISGRQLPIISDTIVDIASHFHER